MQGSGKALLSEWHIRGQWTDKEGSVRQKAGEEFSGKGIASGRQQFMACHRNREQSGMAGVWRSKGV